MPAGTLTATRDIVLAKQHGVVTAPDSKKCPLTPACYVPGSRAPTQEELASVQVTRDMLAFYNLQLEKDTDAMEVDGLWVEGARNIQAPPTAGASHSSLSAADAAAYIAAQAATGRVSLPPS